MTDENSALNNMWECSLLDALSPPPDYELEWAFFCTHDLNETDVSDILAPTLHGGDATDPRRRRTEAVSAFPGADSTEPKVVVFACADAIKYGQGLPWLHIVPVSGRRLHAKCALLRFRTEGGRQKHRAIVMSANLTKNGLMRNREVFVVHEHYHTTRVDSLVGAVANIFRTLIKEQKLDNYSDLFYFLTERLKKIKSNPGKHIIDSFADKGIFNQFVGQRKISADRLIIVSPSFAGPKDSVNLPDLEKLIGKKTKVDVYLDEDARFSVAAQNTLKNLAQLVRYYRIVPQEATTQESTPNAGRRLHAKLLASVRKNNKVEILVGSANFTTNGLGDKKNREIMARLVDVTEEKLNEFLESLGAKKLENAPSDVEPTAREDSVQVDHLPLSAELEVQLQRRNNHVLGTLTVSWHGNLPPPQDLKLEHDGVYLCWPVSTKPSEFTIKKFHMLDGCWALSASATINGQSISRTIPISIFAPEGIWDEAREDCEEEYPEWERLLQLLRAINKKASASQVKTETTNDDAESVKKNDGVFRIPLAQRLVLLARHREKILDALAYEENPEQLIHELLDGDDHGAQECAKTLVCHYTKPQKVEQNPLLKVLREALPELDRLAKEDV